MNKKEVIEKNAMPLEVAIDYLTIYVGITNWPSHISSLWTRLNKKNSTTSGQMMKQALACAILLPWKDRSTYIDSEHPENLLFKVTSYHQFEERDWFDLFKEVIKKDLEIESWRYKALGLGVIDPFEYAPYPRQAYNQLYAHAEESGAINPHTKDDISKRFKNLVLAYGGAVICNIFIRHQEALKQVINWRSGYFFERIIYDVYSPEQILKIKQAELKDTNDKLVKKIRIGN